MKNYLAQITNPALPSSLGSNTGVSFFQKLLPALISLALVVGAIIFVFMLLVGAVQWISSGGDKGNVEAARAKITQALVGIIILFAAFVIVKLVESFFGISILTIDISSFIIQ
jgi:hypothetical protein